MVIVILLTLLSLSVILLGGALCLMYLRPPVIRFGNIEIPPITIAVDFSQAIPTPLVIQFQPVPSDRRLDSVPEKPVPVDVFNYISQESEEHARDTRLRYARKLHMELGDWNLVLKQLESEDNPTLDG